MPKALKGAKLIKFVVVILLLIVTSFIFVVVIKYLTKPKEPDIIYYEGIDVNVKRTDYKNEELPKHVRRIELNASPDKQDKYDRVEFLGLNVVSTGNLSTIKVMDAKDQNELGEALIVKMLLDDRNRDQEFDIVVKLMAPPEYKDEITPRFVSDAARAASDKDLFSTVKPEEIFRAGSKWRVVPYVKNDYTEYFTMAKNTEDFATNVRKTYFETIESYYGRKIPNFIEPAIEGELINYEKVLFPVVVGPNRLP